MNLSTFAAGHKAGCLARVRLFLFEKGLEGIPGLFCTAGFPPGGAFGPTDQIMVAEVGPFLVQDAMGRDLSALVVGIWIVSLALFAAAKIPFTVRARIPPADRPVDRQGTSAKSTIHDDSSLLFSFHPYCTKTPYIYPV
jgi:hypothetical protein